MGLFSFLFTPKTNQKRTSSVLSCPHTCPYVILDVETTGLSQYTDKIIQISAIRYAPDGTPSDFYDTYVNPGCPIPRRASEVNGITDDVVKNAPAANDIQAEFLSFIGNDLLVGYNVAFDLGFLSCAFGNAFDGREYVDALKMARELCCAPNYKLETVSACIGFTPKGAFHDSFSDCEAVAAILSHLNTPLNYWAQEFHCAKPRSSRRYHREPIEITPRCFTEDELDSVSKHPLFMKNIVFTGTLRLTRSEAAQMAADVGAIIKGNVSGKTDYLVVGQQDISLVGEDGMSTKEEKAFALNQSGKGHIKVICESEFLKLVQQGEEAIK